MPEKKFGIWKNGTEHGLSWTLDYDHTINACKSKLGKHSDRLTFGRIVVQQFFYGVELKKKWN